MASRRDEAFEAFYASLADKGGFGGLHLIRKAWDAGRRYEAERIVNLARPLVERYFRADGMDD